MQDDENDISKIQQQFRDLCLEEKRLRDERNENMKKEKRLRDETNKKLTEEKRLRDERNKKLIEEKLLQYETFEEKSNKRNKKVMKDFSEKANVNVSDWHEYVYHYLPLYGAGYTGQNLEKNAEHLRQFDNINRTNRRKSERGLGSSC